MQKKYRLFLLCLGIALGVQAQPYHNEWIPFATGQSHSSQQYFRIGIYKEGVYRISYNEMQNAGVPVSAWFSPERYQLFSKGREQFIKVVDSNNDQLFGPGDYIEFYGKGADGELDLQLYDSAADQPNPRVNLFNDTIAYFLTYNPFSTINRRMQVVTDNNYASYHPLPSFTWEEIKDYNTTYNIGYRDYNKIADNSFGFGEGYYSGEFGVGGTLGPVFNVRKLISGGAVPKVDVALAGANANAHPIEITGGGTTFISQTTFAYDLWRFDFDAINLTASGNYSVQLVPQVDQGFPGNPNYMQLAYVRIRYPRSFDFSGETLPLHLNLNDTASKVLLELANLSAANPLMYVLSGDSVKQIQLGNSGGLFKGIVPMNGTEQVCYLTDASNVMSITGNATFQSVNLDPDPAKFARFNNYQVSGAQADFLIVSNKKIWNGALQYAAYRNSGGHNALLVDINELYDQFAWGVRKSPQAIRSFADFMIDHADPKYLFLLGKSVISMDSRSGSNYDKNLIPTYGEPASDLMFTAKLNSNEFKPELATGRLAATSDADVLAYLDKVQEFEANQAQNPQPWMKNVLHFGGGSNQDEQNSLSTKLAIYRGIVEDTLFGGSVTTFLKSSTAPIQINQSQYLQQMIDSGCSMMTFYGHAAGTSFDVATDDPENYHNKGRYPLILALSCYVGDIHSPGRLLNERYILTPEKGAIAFMAVPDKGIIETLDDYAVPFHEHLFRKDYGKSIGECMRNTVSEIILPDFNRKSVCMNMTLHGDPALVLNQYQQPDFEVKSEGVTFSPSVVTTELDSFTVHVAVSNLGMNVAQGMHLLLSRTMPDGFTKHDTIVSVPYITYRDTVSITLPVDFKNGSGLNDFEVSVDVYDEIQEIDDFTNNITHAYLQINSTDINPVYPQEYAIVPHAQVTLKATTANLFTKPRNYRFEVDTTPLFNSAKLQAGTVNNAFGIVTWTPPVPLDSNVAYFWRVANDSILSGDSSIAANFQWKQSSFLYKPGKSGWSQAHYNQYDKNQFSNVLLVDSSRQFKFILSQYSLVMSHIGTRPSYDINGVNIDYGGCANIAQIAVAVIDSIDFLHPWTADSCQRIFGNYNFYDCFTGKGCNRGRPDAYFLFTPKDTNQMNSLADMIQNKVPDGNYIMSWNPLPVNFNKLPQVVRDAYTNIGVPQFSSLDSTDKFMMLMKKGNPQSLIFTEGKMPDSTLRINYQLTRDWDKGFVTSSLIGPATSYSALHWDYHSLESSSPDSISLQVIGIAGNGQEVVLFDSISAASDKDLSSIDAQMYPYLKLRAYLQDEPLRTPPQLDRWQVYYEPVPEGALNTHYYTFYSDTVEEGDLVKFDMAFQNISDVKMDTLLVDYFLYDKDNVRRNIASVRLNRELPAGDTIMTHVSFSSRGFQGSNNLWIEANPRNDQPEQVHFNNLANLRFYVSKDITNPLLDVTFDGVHILNGDLVSARPEIQVKLKDENKFIALNDTANYRVSITSPSGQLSYLHFEKAQGVNTNPNLLKWTPASLPNNSFSIQYMPELTEDGVYELTVQATDESGNLSGANDYRIQFEVINESSITEVINYPNPFSSATHFVFTLTGSEVPSAMLIQIMTVTGKVVREITMDELGPLHIGRNITEYAWDGKDNFGDQLANGVYLYRVQTRLGNSSINTRSTEAGQYFKKGWGKMYLLR